MPTAWDRSVPPDDKNPLAGLPDYTSRVPPTASVTAPTPGVPPPSATIYDPNWLGSFMNYFNPVPQIQAASVVDTNPNLLLQNRFSEVESIGNPGQGWVWDHSLGHNGNGTAKATATGVIKELVSNQIHVVINQKMNLSVWVKWEDLVYTGTDPISLGVTRYLNGTEVGSEDLVKVEAPAEDSDWILLAYNGYVVPAGCNEIRLRLKIAGTLTAGTVWFDDAEVVKSQPGSGYIGTVVDTVVNGLENTTLPSGGASSGGGWDMFSLLMSMFNQFSTTTDHSLRITLLESLLSTGNKASDEFLREGVDPGPDWNLTYFGPGAGTWATNGDYLYWAVAGASDREVRGRYIGDPPTTATDKQKIVGVLASKGDAYNGVPANLYLYGRMDEGETNWVRADFPTTGGCKITRSLAGVLTDLAVAVPYDLFFAPGGVPAPGAGSTVTLLCGRDGEDRYFEVQINGSKVLDATDFSSNFGEDYRGYGAGVKATGTAVGFALLGQNQPAMLNAWAAVDN